MELFDIVFGQPELVATVVSPLCFVDRLSLSFTCRLVRAVVGEHLDIVKKISTALEHTLHPEQYEEVQKGKAVVSGSFILQMVYGDEFVANDVDLYLIREEISPDESPMLKYDFHTGIIETVLKAGRTMMVDCIYTLEDTRKVIENFDLEICKNYYSEGKLKLVDSEILIKRESTVSNRSLLLTYEKTKRRIQKYTDRGIRILLTELQAVWLSHGGGLRLTHQENVSSMML